MAESSYVEVFSELAYPMHWPVYDDAGTKIDEALVVPGNNRVTLRAWAAVKDDDRIQKRIQERRLRPKFHGEQRDLEILRAPADRRYIRELSAKSKRIKDEDNPFDQTAMGKRIQQLERDLRDLRSRDQALDEQKEMRAAATAG